MPSCRRACVLSLGAEYLDLSNKHVSALYQFLRCHHAADGCVMCVLPYVIAVQSLSSADCSTSCHRNASFVSRRRLRHNRSRER